MKKIDLAIIGGGIMAKVLAHLICKDPMIGEGVIISSDGFHTASTQNQSWLQSGLWYDLNDKKGREEAELCMIYGRKLLDIQDIDPKHRFGIMALGSEAEALQKIEFLRHHGWPQYKDIFGLGDAERLLGGDFSLCTHFTPETCFIKTPDQPFNEGELLRLCDDSVRSRNSHVKPISGVATIKKSAGSRNGYVVIVGNEEFDPKYLFVMAGVNTIRLLAPLGIADRIDLRARRCVLMQAPLITDLAADLFMDTIRHLNVNTITNWRGERTCLFGDILYTDVSDLTGELQGRLVTEEDKRRFLDNYCNPDNFPVLKDRLLRYMANDRNFSVCYKTESDGHLPWTFEAAMYDPELRNLFIAGPGKATLSWYAAQKLLALAKIKIDVESLKFILNPRVSNVKMWFE